MNKRVVLYRITPGRFKRQRCKRYGLRPWEIDALRAAQGERCLCCGNPFNDDWIIDHDHNTEKVRGLACHSCNTLLGRLGDTAERIEERAETLLIYLRDKAPMVDRAVSYMQAHRYVWGRRWTANCRWSLANELWYEPEMLAHMASITAALSR